MFEEAEATAAKYQERLEAERKAREEAAQDEPAEEADAAEEEERDGGYGAPTAPALLVCMAPLTTLQPPNRALDGLPPARAGELVQSI